MYSETGVMGNNLPEIPIIYEDDDILVVTKPSGLVVHHAYPAMPGGGKTKEPALTDWILKHYPALKTVGEPLKAVNRPGIVHRLDKETSGILLIAKTSDSFVYLKKQFQKQAIVKEYRAIVYGYVKDDEGIIDTPIARSVKDFRLRQSVPNDMRGKERSATTRYKTKAHVSDFSYLSVFPETGRTHQIRVHLKGINHPVVCDALYAQKRACPPELGCLALHAYALTFKHPNGTSMRLESPLPTEFQGFIKNNFPKLQEG